MMETESQSSRDKVRTIDVTSITDSVKDEQISLQPSTLIKSLEEVKSPFETEAETNILRAIEEKEREEEESCNKDEKMPALLAGVPSHAVHLFENVLDQHKNNGCHPGENAKSSASIARPFEPTKTARPSLRDVAERMRMMQMVANMKSEQKSTTGVDMANGTEEPVLDDSAIHRDPESLETPESSIHRTSSNNNASGKETHRAKTFYRRRCVPCYTFTSFINVRWSDIKYLLKMFFFLMIPSLGLSAILYYLAGNPLGPYGASYSWWLQFLVRQSITFMLAQFTQFILIDFIALETKLAVMAIGRMLTLMAVQAKGWPLIFVLWAVWDSILLYGVRNGHWLSTQETFDMFNESNPSGSFMYSDVYRHLITAFIVVGLIVMIKRLLVSLMLGKRTYASFGHKMERMMQKVLLIGEVAMLAEEIEFAIKNNAIQNKTMSHQSPANKWLFENYKTKGSNVDDDDQEDDDDQVEEGMREDSELYKVEGMDDSIGSQRLVKKKKGINSWIRFSKNHSKEKTESLLKDSDREVMESLLGEWEEPQLKKKSSWKDVSVRKILQFREALDYLDGSYPLSVPFGPAGTRKQCMISAQNVYRRLLMRTPDDPMLHFETLMTLAIDKEGKLNKEKARALIRLFRPDRQGHLTLLDFIKSCDAMYKKVKMFRVTTSNAVQLDQALEKIVNILFYLVLGVIVSMIFGLSPMGVFTALTGLFLPLSFLFSAAASKYFEGLLLVLVRQPYDIGDRIAVSNPMNDTPPDGSTTWFVEGITLFTTTVRCAATNEVGTYSNGSLASLRIINAARSPKAIVTVKLKFGIDVPYEKVKLFGTVIENFVKDRPREWINLLGFRATAVEADLGYIAYIVILNHVESWQNIGAIKQSQADVASFCLEVSKKMDMRFIAPPMPVDLRLEENAMAAQNFPKVPVNEGDNSMTGNSDQLDPSSIQMIQNLFHKPPVAVTNAKKKK